MKKKTAKIINHCENIEPEKLSEILDLVNDFSSASSPLEIDSLLLLQDMRTEAIYVECHIPAESLVQLGTIDVPLDPEEQAEYKANREIVEDHIAFEQMKDDAISRRTFSNLVCEFTRAYDENHPIKIVGGQHRFTAIQEALAKGINEWHGVKVYFDLNNDQRIDVQLISNTNIAVSTDLFDRMQETLSGPELRNWCQAVGLLDKNTDFADKRARTNPLTVRAARTFILNYFKGKEIDPKDFDISETTPLICKSGIQDQEWIDLKSSNPEMWSDALLIEAGKEFSELIKSQRDYFKAATPKKRTNVDYAEKALNYAVLSSWAFVAGMLHKNKVRLDRHYSLKNQTKKDPLNAAALAKGRHKTDPENYRGLGYRTDSKERGRLTELFYSQTEKGEGIAAQLIDVAIKKYHAKEAQLEVLKAQQKANGK